MQQYVINLFLNGAWAGEGYGAGNSGMEAFENGILAGSVILPTNEEVDVSAIGETGLIVRFSAKQI